MAESAKILNPKKTVLLPDMLAGCSLAESCTYPALKAGQEKLRAEGRDIVTVAYINTSAAVKSLCDWIVTSGNAREVVERIPPGREILFVPDQHLGRWIQEVTGREMILWPGACMVHEIFSLQDLRRAKRNNPGSEVIAHPECPQPILAESDFVGGTEKMRRYVAGIQEPRTFLVATEPSMIHPMKLAAPAARVHPGAGVSSRPPARPARATAARTWRGIHSPKCGIVCGTGSRRSSGGTISTTRRRCWSGACCAIERDSCALRNRKRRAHVACGFRSA